jgi:hypothetical protein
MLSVSGFLIVAAFICTILAAVPPSRVPLWVAVLFLCIVALLGVLPR